MPAGMSWFRYITFVTVALFTFASGSQTVHLIYRPLDDLPQLIQEEYNRRRNAR